MIKFRILTAICISVVVLAACVSGENVSSVKADTSYNMKEVKVLDNGAMLYQDTNGCYWVSGGNNSDRNYAQVMERSSMTGNYGNSSPMCGKMEW